MLLSSIAAVCMLLPMADYKLVWSDEFDKAGRPDPKKWGFEKGFLRNDEKQFYTDRPENVRIEGGNLVIEAKKDNWQGHEITSASVTTEETAAWTYGKFEVRAKLPKGRGTWPAIWMLGKNIDTVDWPNCGEIDIMENVGYDPDRIHFNIHTEAYNHVKGTNKGANIEVKDPWAAFHVYSVEWTPTQLEFFCDGKSTFVFKKESDDPAVWPYAKPEFLILNLAIGGSWGGNKGVDDAIFPARYEIDYVRIYQR
jgi:beta-glucanase (GH16 family)